MYISEIKHIKNYRNLSDKTIQFDSQINFLIGENNLGKTNILELIHAFFTTGKFQEDDFENKEETIEISLVIKYSDDEIGFFEDNFDVEDCHSITVFAIQDSIDERLEYYHGDITGRKLSASTIRKINTLYYYAQRMPSKEVDFRRSNGSGKVLNYLIQSSLKGLSLEEKDLFKTDDMTNIVGSINNNLTKINTITGDTIQAYFDENPEQILCRMLGLGDIDGRDLSKLGEGIQYAFNILLQIIENIYSVKSSRKPEKFEERLIVCDNKKLYPIILILDEPEVHQHPYRQRSLIKKITDLLNNKNDAFLELLQELFNIDGLIGQVFLATHSPNILLNDYTQFIRVYKENTILKIVSGKNISFEEDPKMYKNLLRNFLYFKEAMFSRYIVFVEGDTEMGAIPIFADRLNVDLDSIGAGIIKLDGADSVKRYMSLYQKFGIPSIAIIDKDKEPSYADVPNVYFTTEMDYEEDVYAKFKLSDYLRCCKELDLLNSFIGVLRKKGYNFDCPAFKENPDIVSVSEQDQEVILNEQKESQLAALKRVKNTQKGAILAQYVTSIPDTFVTALNRIAGELT